MGGYLPLDLIIKVADCDIQAAAKLAQLSKACNALLGSKLSEAKQKWRFDRVVAAQKALTAPDLLRFLQPSGRQSTSNDPELLN